MEAVQLAREPGHNDDLEMGKDPAPLTPSLCLCHPFHLKMMN